MTQVWRVEVQDDAGLTSWGSRWRRSDELRFKMMQVWWVEVQDDAGLMSWGSRWRRSDELRFKMTCSFDNLRCDREEISSTSIHDICCRRNLQKIWNAAVVVRKIRVLFLPTTLGGAAMQAARVCQNLIKTVVVWWSWARLCCVWKLPNLS